jgi:hypothetical protein
MVLADYGGNYDWHPGREAAPAVKPDPDGPAPAGQGSPPGKGRRVTANPAWTLPPGHAAPEAAGPDAAAGPPAVTSRGPAELPPANFGPLPGTGSVPGMVPGRVPTAAHLGTAGRSLSLVGTPVGLSPHQPFVDLSLSTRP